MSSIDDFHAFKSTSGGSGGSGGSGCSGDLFTWILVIATVLGSSENYLDKMQPQGASSFLGVPFCLFGYKRGCWVTAIDPRLQNLEFGYSYLAATADCIHKCVIFQIRTQSLIQSVSMIASLIFTNFLDFAWLFQTIFRKHRQGFDASCCFPAFKKPMRRGLVL